jgi:hypothetical protein
LFCHVRTVAALGVVALMSACAVKAPLYQPTIDNVEAVKRSPNKIAIGSFEVQAGAVGGTAITLRADHMNSPVGGNFAAYIGEALKQELTLAGKLDPSSRIVITGLLLKNEISAGGFSTNSGEIQVKFTVTRDGQIRFERVKTASLTWDSSFAAMIAIPKAQESYPRMVQALISSLMTDADFQAAIQ